MLFRTSSHSGPLEIELTRRNIPFVKFGGLKFLDSAHVKDLLAMLRFAQNPRDRVAGFRLMLLLPGNVRAEVTSARSERYDKPGKPVEVTPGTIYDDMRRRDFTVNAMALSLNPGSRGLLTDPFNGVADIEAKVLRVLQNGELSRVGSEHVMHVDVRLLAATNKDLGREVSAGRFREDLLFRLNTIEIHLPPLRDRTDDVT